MHQRTAIVVTSIAAPNDCLRKIAAGSSEQKIKFYVIGDAASPGDFSLPGCDFYSLERQYSLGFRFTELCPIRHYARKNIGYLAAIRDGCEQIVETDDDNYPLSGFWNSRERFQTAPLVDRGGWLNVYASFSSEKIWPRGLPLDAILDAPPDEPGLPLARIDAPIQQGLADDNPDVDAIYRLILPLPVKFRDGFRIALGPGTWCPFNSQNTTWWRDAFPLLYLPAYCSFRMTDIWRSFVAQRIAWENGWRLLFESPTMRQERNLHNLMRDFADEVPGYLGNRRICEKLESLPLSAGMSAIRDNMRICYEMLVREAYLKAEEMPLLEAWLADLA